MRTAPQSPVVRPKERHADPRRKQPEPQDAEVTGVAGVTEDRAARREGAGLRMWRRGRGGGGASSRASSLSPAPSATERRRRRSRDPDQTGTGPGIRTGTRTRTSRTSKLHKRHSHGRTHRSRSSAAAVAVAMSTTPAAPKHHLHTLEVFGDRTGGGGEEPASAQQEEEPGERGVHALQVTHHLFQAVSGQMERWYERKVEEARQQVEVQAQAERRALVKRIGCLEDQLRLLRTAAPDDG
ncbi:hypothetical protein CRUP_030898 [Coryphaenoides rupestris]|nr:hypothetical protein CRUP_030898 [Coryphaenoides rupestris]